MIYIVPCRTEAVSKRRRYFDGLAFRRGDGVAVCTCVGEGARMWWGSVKYFDVVLLNYTSS